MEGAPPAEVGVVGETGEVGGWMLGTTHVVAAHVIMNVGNYNII